MSHNVQLKGVSFTDAAILAQAVSELNSENVSSKYEFVDQPCEIRGWVGQRTRVDAAIKCPHGKYDIGFTKAADGSYTPILEDMFNDPAISADYNAKTVSGDPVCRYSANEALLGKLSQRYAVINTENNARRMGSMTRRVVAENGIINLEVMHR